MSYTQEQRQAVVRRVESFITLNYDVDHDKSCMDPECPGNFYEADDIVHTVLEALTEEGDIFAHVEVSDPVPTRPSLWSRLTRWAFGL